MAVLAETTDELNMAQLVDPGVVGGARCRRHRCSGSCPSTFAVRALLAIARATDDVLDEIGRLAGAIPRPPSSVIVLVRTPGAGTRRQHRSGRRTPDRHR